MARRYRANSKTHQDSEDIFRKSLEVHGGVEASFIYFGRDDKPANEKRIDAKQMRFVHAYPNSLIDQGGIDFLIFIKVKLDDGSFYPLPFCFPFQVKTSDTKNTVGLFLPVSVREIDKQTPVTDKMLNKSAEHFKKHPEVPYIIFVGRVDLNDGGEAGVTGDIWGEIKRVINFSMKKILGSDLLE